MARNFVIIILAVLLGISSYLLYSNKNITINLGGTGDDSRDNKIPEAAAEKPEMKELYEGDVAGTVQLKNGSLPETQDRVETLDSEFEPEIHLDPTIGMTISSERQIVSSYKIISPRKFSLLTDDDKTMVEIDLDTGRVKINPEYDLDEVTTQFWKSIGNKYPEVCFVE